MTVRCLSVLPLMFLAACGKDPVPVPEVSQLALHFSGMTGRVGVMAVGDQLRVVAEARDSAGQLLSNIEVHFVSTAPQFADVATDGIVSSKAAGSAFIVGTAEGRAAAVRDSLLVTVAVPVSGRP